MKGKYPFLRRGKPIMSKIISPHQAKPIIITLQYDQITGQTQLTTSQPINELFVAGLLSEHVSGLLRQLLMKGGNPDATQEKNDSGRNTTGQSSN
jgi:hypothetical protein